MKLIHINFNNYDIIIFGSLFFFSFLIFLFYVNLNAFDSYWDENGYLTLGQQVLDNGLFEFRSDVRTYLYPAIIASLKIFSSDDVTTKIILSVIQYAVYLITVIFIANYTVSKNSNKIIWHSIVAFGFLNPFLISATTLVLSDILAACFLAVSIFSLTRFDLNQSKFALFAIGLFYASVMIRPTSVILLPIVVAIILFRFLKNKNINLLKISLISLVLLVIFMPQLYVNVTQKGEWTPLITDPLYEKHTSWGTQFIKGGSTVVIPGEAPSLAYKSPFPLPEENLTMYQLILKDPSTFLLLSFSHIFGALDWDYVDTYMKDFYPDNRIPASLLIYSTWFFVICGFFAARKNFSTTDGFLLKTLIISVILYMAFIATISITHRYGYPIFFLLLPFSGYGIKYLFDSIIRYHKTSKLWIKRIGFISVYSIFILTFFYISFLFSYQSGRIDWFGYFNLFSTKYLFIKIKFIKTRKIRKRKFLILSLIFYPNFAKSF